MKNMPNIHLQGYCYDIMYTIRLFQKALKMDDDELLYAINVLKSILNLNIDSFKERIDELVENEATQEQKEEFVKILNDCVSLSARVLDQKEHILLVPDFYLKFKGITTIFDEASKEIEIKFLSSLKNAKRLREILSSFGISFSQSLLLMLIIFLF